MANDPVPGTAALPREVDFLLFGAAGVAIGVEASQVQGIVRASQAEASGIPVATLDGILARGGGASPTDGTVLVFRDGGGTSGLAVDGLDSMESVAIEAIRPLPQLLASGGGPKPFWGVLPRGPEVVLLIDLQRLAGLVHEAARA
jgi:hypothetical protein